MTIRLLPHAKIFFALMSIVVSAAIAASPALAQSSQLTAAVNTVDGPVRGFVRDGVSIFLGIPYAAPPTGELRWKPPTPATKHALLNATKFGGACPQSNPLGVFTAGQSVDEDCLTLNIFTTGIAASNGKLKPVIVWIHGGGSFTGTSADYDGSALAKGGPEGTPAVVVTFNFRLGLFGYLAHPALKRQGSTFANYGIMDQQAALRWVQANIRSFGGDPARVALGGQSAGSANTQAHLVSPLSKGLFSRAILMSAPLGVFASLDTAMDRAKGFAAAAGCPEMDEAAMRCLRRLSPARILQLQGTINSNGPYLATSDQEIVDGTIIPMQPSQAYASGEFNRVPVMGGVARDEFTFLIGIDEYFSGSPPRPLSAEDHAAKIAKYFGSRANRVLAQYSVAQYGDDPVKASTRVFGDSLECKSNLGALKLVAAVVPTYAWDFTYQDAPFYMPHMPGFRALASHTIDIQFLFRGFHGGPIGVNLDQLTGMPRELNSLETRLSDRMIGFWTNFADSGSPNGKGRQEWPRIDPSAPVVLSLDIPVSTVPEAKFRAQYNCDFWDALNHR